MFKVAKQQNQKARIKELNTRLVRHMLFNLNFTLEDSDLLNQKLNLVL